MMAMAHSAVTAGFLGSPKTPVAASCFALQVFHPFGDGRVHLIFEGFVSRLRLGATA